MCKLRTPSVVPVLTLQHNLNDVCKGSLDYSTYHTTKALNLPVFEGKNVFFSLKLLEQQVGALLGIEFFLRLCQSFIQGTFLSSFIKI